MAGAGFCSRHAVGWRDQSHFKADRQGALHKRTASAHSISCLQAHWPGSCELPGKYASLADEQCAPDSPRASVHSFSSSAMGICHSRLYSSSHIRLSLLAVATPFASPAPPVFLGCMLGVADSAALMGLGEEASAPIERRGDDMGVAEGEVAAAEAAAARAALSAASRRASAVGPPSLWMRVRRSAWS